MEPEHEIVSVDYVSMFTNIDVAETFDIILEYYHIISVTTSVPADIFMKCLSFFAKKATFFMFNGAIYKQIKGLAMGNKLAQVLAEIKTNFAFYEALKHFDADVISFMYKYVDNVFASIHRNSLFSVKNKIAEIVGMELTLTRENDNLDIEFLDCTFRRNEDLTISSRWLKKSYSSLSILNFHSHHPMSMKNNIVHEMVKHADAITSPEFIDATRSLVIDILRRSSYPELFINEYVYVTPFAAIEPGLRKMKDPSQRYVSCPFVNPLFDDMQSVINENGLKIRLAPKPSFNNKRELFRELRTFVTRHRLRI